MLPRGYTGGTTCPQHDRGGEPPATSRRAQRALRQAAQSFKSGDLETFYETLSVASFRDRQISVSLARPQDPDCPIIGVSEGFELLTGYSVAEIIGRNCRLLNKGCAIKAEDRHRMRIAVRTGKSFVGLLQNRRRDGEVFTNLLHLSALRIGSSLYMLGIQADVTNAEPNLAEARAAADVQDIVDAIFAANVEAWATLQVKQYHVAKLRGLVPYAKMMLQSCCDPELYSKAREAFVCSEHDALQNQVLSKNTFLEVYDGEEDPRATMMNLRRVFSEPSFPSGQGAPVDMLKRPLQACGSPTLMREDAGAAWRRLEALERPGDGTDVDLSHPGLQQGEGCTEQKSVGSLMHPSLCTPCSFYCYSLIGCNRGEACLYCHMDHPRKGRRRGQKRRGGYRPHDDNAGDDDMQENHDDSGAEEPAPTRRPPEARRERNKLIVGVAPTPDGLLPLLTALELLSPLPTPEGKSVGKGVPLTTEKPQMTLKYSEAVIILTVGQWKNVLPFVDGPAREFRFSVCPVLPRGLALAPATGVISGFARETTPPEGSAHTVSVECRAGGDDTTSAHTTLHILVIDPHVIETI